MTTMTQTPAPWGTSRMGPYEGEPAVPQTTPGDGAGPGEANGSDATESHDQDQSD